MLNFEYQKFYFFLMEPNSQIRASFSLQILNFHLHLFNGSGLSTVYCNSLVPYNYQKKLYTLSRLLKMDECVARADRDGPCPRLVCPCPRGGGVRSSMARRSAQGWVMRAVADGKLHKAADHSRARMEHDTERCAAARRTPTRTRGGAGLATDGSGRRRLVGVAVRGSAKHVTAS